MAHQYPPTPSFSGGFPPPPPYYPFGPNGIPQQTNTPPIMAQSAGQRSNLHTPTPIGNNHRYDANSNVSAPPLPFPFPPNFNPDLFKQFAGTNVPPPPLPPFAGASMSPANFPPFAQPMTPHSVHYVHPQNQNTFTPQTQAQPLHVTHNHFASMANLQSSHAGSSLSNHSQLSRPQEMFPSQQNSASEQRDTETHKFHTSSGANPPMHTLSYNYDGAAASVPAKPPVSEHRGTDFPTSEQSNSYTASAQKLPGLDHSSQDIDVSNSHGTSSVPVNNASMTSPSTLLVPSSFESRPSTQAVATQASNTFTKAGLREQAKNAISALSPYGITYANFVSEGVDSTILKRLFDELGLTQNESTNHATTSTEPKISTTSKTETTLAKPASTSFSQIKPLASGTSNMERKDRIAQLLAAKAGRPSPTGTTSQSASPAPVAPQSVTEPLSKIVVATQPSFEGRHAEPLPATQPEKSRVQTDLVRQKMEMLRKETLSKQNLPSHRTASPLDAVDGLVQSEQNILLAKTNLPTPVREGIMEKGFSAMIPGLFMTSDAEDEYQENVSLQHDSPQSDIEEEADIEPSNRLQNRLKRSLESTSFEEDDTVQSKRFALDTDEINDVEMDVSRSDEESSDGEISEEEGEYEPSIEPVTHTLSDDCQPDLERSTVDKGLPSASHSLPLQSELPLDVRSDANRVSTEGEYKLYSKRVDNWQSPASSGLNTPASQKPEQVTLSPTASKSTETSGTPTSTKVENSAFTGLRPKVNQNKLNERMAALKADLQRKNQRKKALDDGMPVLAAEVEKTKAVLNEKHDRLAEIKIEIQKKETEISLMRESEHELSDQITQLETQLQEGVSGQSQFSRELIQLNEQIAAQETQADGNSGLTKSFTPATTLASAKLLTGPGGELVERDAHNGVSGTIQTQPIAANGAKDQNSPSANSDMKIDDIVGHDRSASPAQQEVDRQLASGLLQSKSSTPPQDFQDVGEESSALTDSASGSEDSRMSIDEVSVAGSEDSVSMSDGGSEDYEPADPEEQSLDSPNDSSKNSELQPNNNLQLPGLDVEGDEYEPSENIDSIGRNGVLEAGEGDDTSMVGGELQEQPDVPNDAAQEVTPSLVEHMPHVSAASPQKNNADDLEQGLQLTEADTLTKAQEVHVQESDVTHSLLEVQKALTPVHFVPYQSPLTLFKTFRFHPQYNELVKNGYRSLTYSNKIDPSRPICPTELAGEVCTDTDCEEQHFGSMALPDDRILVQMSSASDIKDRTQRDSYLRGLKQVIADLRQRGVKDFSLVADALSKYRREWFVARPNL